MTLPPEARAAVRWLAWTAYQRGRLDHAQVLVDGLAASDAHDAASAELQTEVALARLDSARALEAAENWRRIEPRRSAPMMALSRALRMRGDMRLAHEWLQHAAAAGSQTAVAVLRRSRVGS